MRVLVPLIALAVAPLASAQVQDDCAITLAAWRAMGGPGSYTNGCNIVGVMSGGTPRKVSSISWQNKGLKGPISPLLGDLRSLGWLSLQGNKLTGSIPLSFGNLRNLQVLNLGNNQLTGTLPSTMSNMKALRSLSLGGNRLTGDTRILAGLSQSAVFRLYPNAFTTTNAPLQLEAANLDPIVLANNLAAGRSLKKRQLTSYGQEGEKNITTYCPLDGGITKEIVLGCIYGLQAYCNGGSPMSSCHNYYTQVFRNSKRYNQMGVNCPPWRAGPFSQSCAADMSGIETTVKLAAATDPTIQETDWKFPYSVNNNLFKSPKWAPCVSGAYKDLVCVPR